MREAWYRERRMFVRGAPLFAIAWVTVLCACASDASEVSPGAASNGADDADGSTAAATTMPGGTGDSGGSTANSEGSDSMDAGSASQSGTDSTTSTTTTASTGDAAGSTGSAQGTGTDTQAVACDPLGQGPCLECVTESCCTQLEACAGAPLCSCWYDCFGTGDFEGCGQMCGVPEPQAFDVIDCAVQMCGNLCGV